MEPETTDQLSQTSSDGLGMGGVLGILIGLTLTLVMMIGLWKMFTKAGQPGWAILIPFYSLFVMVKVAGKPVLWFVLCLVPFVNFVVLLMLPFALATRFGKGTGFALGLLFLPFIFYPMLGFGDATYIPAPEAATA